MVNSKTHRNLQDLIKHQIRRDMEVEDKVLIRNGKGELWLLSDRCKLSFISKLSTLHVKK